MNKTELANQIGISRELLHRHIKRGCPVDSLESALLWRSKNLDLTQTKQSRITGNSGGKKSKSDSQSNETEIISSDMAELVRKVNDSQLDLETTNADELFKNSRALKEKALALQAAAEHEKFTGSLVEKATVEKIIFERARQFRDGVMACSRRIAPEVIGKESIVEIESLIQKELRAMLEQFAKLPVIERTD
ncbi:MAG: hypothetical protein K2Y09_10875 [Nitrosomonas sp.]|uniref:hypothetical protein n=1 Tax=Nitrosomonas sp. TaxID=42353 RepID=UPI001E16F149|nr:hypothetical protein [Nitrosomonas sp.]MBX9895664.1 hypothetical protein [Nitrosomonas sp.]